MRRLALAAAACLAALAVSADALAQAYPSRPVRVVVAFPAGSATDSVARAIGQRLSERMGQPFVIENRAGAGGNIGTVAVRGSAADGYTLLAHSVAFSVNQNLYRSAGYDATRDFKAVGIVAQTPNILFVHPSVNANDLRGLLALARTQRLSYASSGSGTTTHLGAELLFRSLGRVEVTHVPFTPAEAATQVVGGQLPVGSTSMPPAVQLIRAGRVKPIAVTSLERSPALPDVPTVAEQGHPGFEALTWFGFFAPTQVPDAVIERLNAETRAVLAMPEVVAQLANLGLTPMLQSPAQAQAYVDAERTKWAEVIKVSGATAD
jgi:tripartite-type tricarboxylate transporter receptor subunit TctC